MTHIQLTIDELRAAIKIQHLELRQLVKIHHLGGERLRFECNYCAEQSNDASTMLLHMEHAHDL